MSDSEFLRRKQQLMDKFLSGEIDKSTYDALRSELNEFDSTPVHHTKSDRLQAPQVLSSSARAISITESNFPGEHKSPSNPVALLEPGTDLGGFRLERCLGRGGMGEVWQAADPTAERKVVIKVLPPNLQHAPDEIERVKQAFQRIHELQHENICPVYLLGQDPRFGYFVVMKYIDGFTLAVHRQNYVQRHGSFPAREVARVLAPVAAALDYAHRRQIVHRDVKPQNIMLSADGRDIQLVDFGLAAEVRSSVQQSSQTRMETSGTLPYMAPEQWRGQGQDARTDQYALAVVAFELLSGRHPFHATDLTVLRICVLNDQPPKLESVKDSINDVLARGMAKSKGDRFSNCSDFVKALSKATSKSTLQPPKVREVFEDDDDVVSDRTTKSQARSKSPAARDLRDKSALESANARAMFWISIIGTTGVTVVMGVTVWFLYASAKYLVAPNDSRISASSIASNVATNAVVPVEDTQATGGPSNPDAKQEKRRLPLRYAWEHGKPYVYSVNVELEPDNDLVLALSGSATYTRGQPVVSKRESPEEGNGTGTGFVVQPNGYLLTCQHVVEGASEIEVALGGKKYSANVVGEDIDHDLAIIHIDAAGLPTLALSDSETVQVGEEVRAIGFPFSSILGDNIKATRGTISGVNHEENRKVFQVDAGINPGNSGGPLVNERGDVIGVNFAKLREEVATSVGFAVPINDGVALLKAEGLNGFRSGGRGPKLDGPELVKKVAAATALITVTIGGDAEAGLHHFEMKCQGAFTSSTRSRFGKTVDSAKAFNWQRGSRFQGTSTAEVVETDPLGRVHEIAGNRSPLPAFLGPLSTLVLEQFPLTRRKSWSSNHPVTVVFSEASGDSVGVPHRFRPRFRPPGFPPFPGESQNVGKTTKYPGQLRIAFSIDDDSAPLLKIKKEFHLTAQSQETKDPRVKMEGTGVLLFDSQRGVPRSLEFSAVLVENEPNKTTRQPIKLTYSLRDDGSGPEVIDQAVAAIPRGVQQPGEMPVQDNVASQDIPVKLSGEDVRQCLDDLTGTNIGRANHAAARLQNAIPQDDQRGRVLDALNRLLANKDPFRRKQAVEIMAVWSTPATVPVLIRCLDENAYLVKLAAIDALGRLKDERAAEPLSKLLTIPGPRVPAAAALRSLGSKAESAVQPLMKHTEPDVRAEACRLLKEIGTAASEPLLQEAANDANQSVAKLAKDALNQISKRQSAFHQ